MKKIFVCAFFILFLINIYSTILAVDTWFEPYSSCFSVDLSATEKYTGSQIGIFDDPEQGIYGDYDKTDMLGVIGITNNNEAIESGTVTVNMDFSNTNNFTYVSQGDDTLSVPYGIDITIRYRVDHNSHGILGNVTDRTDSVGYYTYKLNGKNVSHYGYNDNTLSALSEGADSFSFSISDLNLNPNGLQEGWDGPDWLVGSRYHYNELIAIWIDFILVLPEKARQSGEFLIGNASDYMSQFNVSVGGIASGSYFVTLTGYNGTAKPDDMSVLFTITPYPSSFSLNVSNLINGDIETIGSYSYSNAATETKSEPTISNSPFYIFASSSSDPLEDNPGYFVMKHEDAVVDDLNGRNGFYYEIGLDSTASSSYSSDDRNRPDIVWYDGNIGAGTISNAGNDKNSKLMSAIRKERKHGTLWTYSFFDNGEIKIRYREDNSVPPLNLVGGSYSSTIYLHLISTQ